jgi:hypothetical protein
MDQLSQLTKELQDISKGLHPVRDHKLVKYLCGEVQHLINRVEFGRALGSDETYELESRKEIVEMFKQFYSYMILMPNRTTTLMRREWKNDQPI